MVSKMKMKQKNKNKTHLRPKRLRPPLEIFLYGSSSLMYKLSNYA